MALLCYANLDDGHSGTTSLDELDAELSKWVFGLLADAEIQGRSAQLVEPFATAPGERGAEVIALRAIRLIAYAREQLLTKNAYLRYLCSDCPRGDDHASCRRGSKPSPPAGTAPAPSREIRFAGIRVRSTALLPTTSAVVERIRSIAATIEEFSAGDEEASAARARFVSEMYQMAHQWRTRGIDDTAVDVEEPDPMRFYGNVLVTLSRARNVEREGADVRHSPVNFIAAVLKALALQLTSHPMSVARESVIAALVARNAAIEGDIETVDEFTKSWLGFSRPEMWREAVEMALLGDWVETLGARLSRDAEVMALLGRHARAEHLHLQPIWERKACGHRLRLLEDPVSEGLTLGDFITDRRLPEDMVLGRVEDDRVPSVLQALTPEERTVAKVYAASRMTWAQAAEATGADDPVTFGERVRRKLKRLGRRRQALAAAAVRSTAAAW
ncbi:hypothetical protein G7Z12_08575 [Streptomyces sp. ID38640]|uniref:hypothetical protein n=1 Tax=Streptomyces sp. ID38640 TaxID=1265399 RepID=UPI00140EDC44|nr:hypothetical protein [Streptomyces sp. ID38640]QIK06070.1 hypothetical protein G7Z12_08575 [Streptomyces sp. ID38640]